MRFLALVAFATLSSCGAPGNETSSDDEIDNLSAEILAGAVNRTGTTEEPAGWTYSSKSDPMSDEKMELACVQSSNSIYLSPPYGETGASLCLRNSPQFGRDAYVSLNENGQILCRSYESCQIRVRFDKAPAENWSAIGPSDHSTDMVFIQNREGFERKLRSTKTTNVQLEFYQNGLQTFTFNTAGLTWGKDSKGAGE